jgi:hypothetical protein
MTNQQLIEENDALYEANVNLKASLQDVQDKIADIISDSDSEDEDDDLDDDEDENEED